MKLQVFSVFDSKTAAFSQPYLFQTKGQALRSFSDSVQDPNSSFHKHPGDYTFFQLGEWDDEDGTLTPLESKLNLGTALEFLAPKK